ncbi:MAG: ribosome maturation factor RimP [Candidatus Omnitrophota bacterium]|nr:ribosome maturation factor RimP [Candidatus Omnitrophota bacterium]
MDKETITAELKGILADFLKARQVELVDLACNYQGKDLVVRILADYPEGGISIGECAALNREIGLLLDEKNILELDYILEVSSPGVDRPLKESSDFLRCVNRRVRVFFNTPIGGRWELEGIIKKVEEAVILMDDKESRAIEVPISEINRAKQVI